jgi:hypothetical protein
MKRQPRPVPGWVITDNYTDEELPPEERVRQALQEAGVPVQPAGGVDVRDPWGNNIQVVDYREIQFTKADHVLRGMGLDGLEKTEQALDELRRKGLAPDS